MAYDEGLAERLRETFFERNDVTEKRMFGGLCFMVAGHMCIGIVGETLMVRVGPERYKELLSREEASEMDFTGKPMKGFIYVLPDGIAEDDSLSEWVGHALAFNRELPER